MKISLPLQLNVTMKALVSTREGSYHWTAAMDLLTSWAEGFKQMLPLSTMSRIKRSMRLSAARVIAEAHCMIARWGSLVISVGRRSFVGSPTALGVGIEMGIKIALASQIALDAILPRAASVVLAS